MRMYTARGPTDDAQEPAPQRLTLLDRNIDLSAVTPIYRGAAKQDGIDTAYPFRGPSLRGQLRAWWRAVQPTTSLEELRREERRIFGGVHGGTVARSSRVSLGLSQMSSTPGTRGDLAKGAGSDLPYALGQVDQGRTDELYHLDAKARLQVVAHFNPDDGVTAESARLDKALKALVLLGGAGGRTRRGLGRLWSNELLGDSVANIEELAGLVRSLAPEPGVRRWPSLAGADVAWKRAMLCKKAAQAANTALVDFQHVRGMQKTSGGYSGEERAREAQEDWLRIRGGETLKEAFSAALGMPLAYRSVNGHLPKDVTAVEVSPSTATRLPSPVHIRPVPTRDGNWAAAMVVLRPWYQGAIKVKAGRKTTQGTLHPGATDILLRELTKRGWDVIRGDR